MRKYIFLSVVVLVSCIKPLDITLEDNGSNLLVVEGSIDTAPGPHVIQITRTAKYGITDIFGGLIERETGANVSIRDDLGNVTFLEDVGNGVYSTIPSFRAEVGRSYILQIETADGERFNSVPETIVPVTPVDSIYIIQEDKVPTDNPLVFTGGLQVYADIEDNPEISNYSLWSYDGYYQINSFPELHTAMGFPAPKDCCATCWTREFTNSPTVFETDLIRTIPVGFIEDDGVRYENKYIMAINQYSLSVEDYNFYQLVNQQLSIDGDIFDPPPATVRGNIINLDNPDQNVIGFFRASDVTQDTIVLVKKDLANPRNKKIIKDDCLTWTFNATTELPEFWVRWNSD